MCCNNHEEIFSERVKITGYIFYKIISVTGGCKNNHSKRSEQDPSEGGPPNRFVLEDGTTASFQNSVSRSMELT
jgi:hypothetical protein